MNYRVNPGFIVIGILFLFLPFSGFSQLTKIMGTVTDAKTKEPVPFVNIFLKGTVYGTLTDFAGKFSLEVKEPGDSITVKYLGYKPQSRKVLKNQFQTLNFELSPENVTLPEIVVKYTGNPAEVILKKVIANKDK